MSFLEPFKLLTESLWASEASGLPQQGVSQGADHPASFPWPSAFTKGKKGRGSQPPPESEHAQGHLAHVGQGCSWWTGHLLLTSACHPRGPQAPVDVRGVPFAHHLASQTSSLLLPRSPKALLSRWASHSCPDAPALQKLSRLV